MTAIAPHMSAFLEDYLVRQRGSSAHTCDTYAYSFQLLFKFTSEQLKLLPSAMELEQIDAPLVTRFLEYCEVSLGNTPSTRNVRLAAIKSFFHFLEFRVPSAMDQCCRIFSIPFKRTESRLVPYLTKEETQAILDMPDMSTRNGIRDYAMIHLALTTGLRVAELTGLLITDLTFQPSASILIRGKGRQERKLPLWKETVTTLQSWLSVRGDVQTPELFVNNRGEQLTRWGFAHLLKKYVKLASHECQTLEKKRVSPHVLRHTCAMTALLATRDIRKVALWLGHNSTQSTEVYVRADPTEKLEAINSIIPVSIRKGEFSVPDKLIASLKR